MKDMATMMLALGRFCREHNIEMPYSVEVRFTDEMDARRFTQGLKADCGASTMIFRTDHSGVDRICSTPIRVSYAEREGTMVRV